MGGARTGWWRSAGRGSAAPTAGSSLVREAGYVEILGRPAGTWCGTAHIGYAVDSHDDQMRRRSPMVTLVPLPCQSLINHNAAGLHGGHLVNCTPHRVCPLQSPALSAPSGNLKCHGDSYPLVNSSQPNIQRPACRVHPWITHLSTTHNHCTSPIGVLDIHCHRNVSLSPLISCFRSFFLRMYSCCTDIHTLPHDVDGITNNCKHTRHTDAGKVRRTGVGRDTQSQSDAGLAGLLLVSSGRLAALPASQHSFVRQKKEEKNSE